MPASRLLILLFLCGCASSEPVRVSYDPSRGLSTYASAKVLIGYRDMSGGLASGQRVMSQAFASCFGEGCRPEEVHLVFMNDSSSDLNLDYRRLQIIFGRTTRDWEDLNRIDEPAHYAVPRGEFIRVSLTAADFAGMAAAAEVGVVFGLTGTSVFNVPFERRAPFRALAEKIGL